MQGSYINGFAPRDGQPLYPELWRGCVGAWAPCLGPTGLTLRDWSGCSNHLSLTSMDAGTDWVSNQGRYTLDYDGMNDYCLGHNAVPLSLASAAWTIATWIYIRTYQLDNAWNAYVVGSADFRAFTFGLYNSRLSLIFSTTGSSWVAITTGATTVSAGRWHHIAATRTAWGTHTVYLNGVPDGTLISAGGVVLNNQILKVCAHYGLVSNRHNNGFQDDTIAYNRDLPLRELRLLASRRGIAYELAPRRRSRIFTGGFKTIWAARKAQIIGGGV